MGDAGLRSLVQVGKQRPRRYQFRRKPEFAKFPGKAVSKLLVEPFRAPPCVKQPVRPAVYNDAALLIKGTRDKRFFTEQRLLDNDLFYVQAPLSWPST